MKPKLCTRRSLTGKKAKMNETWCETFLGGEFAFLDVLTKTMKSDESFPSERHKNFLRYIEDLPFPYLVRGGAA